MKLDDDYTSIDVCPVTREQNNDVYWTDGVCPHCGDARPDIAHHDKVVGRYNRPNLFERLFQGKRTEFLTKEDEDAVWGPLTNKGDK